MRCAPWSLMLLCTLSLPADSVRAQLAPRDSLRILDQARNAQFRFETFRRMNLPLHSPPADHECEVVVGRMCYWNDDERHGDGEADTIIVEPSRIFEARRKLVDRLDRLSAQSRADPWISGQRVRYMIEGGEDSAAVVAARECWSDKWWCNALLGFALHNAGSYAESEAAYDSALAQMPRDIRCRWTDISLLLEDDARESYQRLPCEQRAETERHFWMLARPSYVVGGNDRRTEHFSRVLLAELSSNATNPYGMRWGDDMRELLIRYGAPLWYVSVMGRTFYEKSSTTGHERQPAYHFAANFDGDSANWNLRAPRARERYAPRYMDRVTDLDAQFVMLKRGDSAIVIAIYADSVPTAETTLGVLGDSGAIVVRTDTSGIRVRSARTAWKGVMAAIEQYDPTTHRDARARTWIAPPQRADGAPELSTLLLFAGDSTAASTLGEVLPRALTANELRDSRKLGIYWEMYGGAEAALPTAGDSAVPRGSTVRRDSVAPVDTAAAHLAPTTAAHAASATTNDAGPDVTITVTRTDGGALRWLSQALRITRRDSPISVQWHDTPLRNGVSARSVVLDLAQLPAGRYLVTLAAGNDSVQRTVASRQIRLR